MTTRCLDRLFRPKSIAVFGGREAARVLEQCDRMGFAGEIWPVHPTRDMIGEHRCFRSVAELPAAPDAAFVGVNRSATIEIVRALAARGAGGAICYASGFREAESGAALEDELVAAAGSMPVLGPNCYGLINYLDGVPLWPDQHGGAPVARGVAIITQSSNIALNMTMQRRGLPIAYVATAGNQAQTTLADIASELIEDDRVTAIGLHIEGIAGVARFEALALRARALAKPIAAIFVGGSEQARGAALSHTASIAGSDSAVAAFFARLGIPRLRSIPEFLETLKLLHVHGALPGRDLCSMSCSGGEAALMADAALGRGVRFRRARRGGEGAREGDAERACRGGEPARLSHLHLGAGGGDGGHLRRDDRLRLRSFAPRSRLSARRPLRRCRLARRVESPRRGGRAHRRPRRNGRVAFRRACRRPMLQSFWRRAWHRSTASTKRLQLPTQPPWSAKAGRWPRPGRCCRRWRRARIPSSSTRAKPSRRSRRSALRCPLRRVAASPCCAAEAAEALGYPVVVKALGVAHKTDVGGVRLNLSSAREVAEAAESLAGLSSSLLVERMVTDQVAELLIGVVRDPQFGLLMRIAAGGVLVELLGDVASLLLPTTADEVRRAILSLMMAPLLTGYRGRPAADIEAAIAAALAIARFAEAHADGLEELDVNPLMVRPEGKGAVAVDALIRMRAGA